MSVLPQVLSQSVQRQNATAQACGCFCVSRVDSLSPLYGCVAGRARLWCKSAPVCLPPPAGAASQVCPAAQQTELQAQARRTKTTAGLQGEWLLCCLSPARSAGLAGDCRLASSQAAGPGVLSKLGKVLREKASGDFGRVFQGASKTRERLGVSAEPFAAAFLASSARGVVTQQH